MATRNERKRLAKARHAELEQAVFEAIKADKERTDKRNAIAAPLDFHDILPKSSNGTMVERRGSIVKGKYVSRPVEPSKPLAHDGNKSGYGQLRVRWTNS